MKLKYYLISFLSVALLCPINLFAVIRVVCSAALTHNHFEYRKQQYIEAFGKIATFGYPKFYVIEAVKKHGPTFLNDLTPHVFYATVNNPNLRNNGINEALTMLEGCKHFNFDPEDIIIKLTGRHSIISDHLFKSIENNCDADAFVKINEDGNVFTLGFGMRYKYLKEMFETIDYGPLERGMIPLEYRVGDYIKRKKREGNFKVIYLDKLDIRADVYGSSTAPGVSGIGYH